MKVTDSEEHPSLLQCIVNCGYKKFYSTGPWSIAHEEILEGIYPLFCKLDHFSEIFVISLVYFVPGKLFQSSLMFVGEAKGALLVNYGRKKFYRIGPWLDTNFVRMFFRFSKKML
jgi:hypothetical protein